MSPTLVLALSLCAQPGLVKVDSVLITLIEQVEVSARDPGIIQKVMVTEGMRVKAGDVLTQLDDAEVAIALQKARLELQVATAEAGNDVKVRYAEKSLDVAKAEIRRANDAGDKFRKSISQSELDQLRLTAERSELEIEQAKHDLAISKLTIEMKRNAVDAATQAMDRRTIRSPINGMVVRIKRRVGETVQPNDPLIRILQIDRLRAEGFVAAKDASPALVGSTADLLVDLPGRLKASFTGKIVFIDPEINAISNQVRVWAEVANPDLLLRPGMPAQMTIGGSHRAPAATARDDQ